MDQWFGRKQNLAGYTAAGWPCDIPLNQVSDHIESYWRIAHTHYGDVQFGRLAELSTQAGLHGTTFPYHFPRVTHNFAGAAPIDTEDPTTPGSPAAVASSSSQITLTWTAATDNVGVTGYRIDHCTHRRMYADDPARRRPRLTVCPYGLDAHRACIATGSSARDAAGNQSAPTATVEATTNASNPADVVAPTVPGSPSAVANYLVTDHPDVDRGDG